MKTYYAKCLTIVTEVLINAQNSLCDACDDATHEGCCYTQMKVHT